MNYEFEVGLLWEMSHAQNDMYRLWSTARSFESESIIVFLFGNLSLQVVALLDVSREESDISSGSSAPSLETQSILVFFSGNHALQIVVPWHVSHV